MKLFVVLSLVALAVAAPQPQQRSQNPGDVQILRYETDNIGLGSYRYDFEQSDGTRHDEQGELRNAGAEDESIAVKGSYSWVGPDGVTYMVNYVADENGFQPTIEQGPGGAVPSAVVASLLGISLDALLMDFNNRTQKPPAVNQQIQQGFSQAIQGQGQQIQQSYSSSSGFSSGSISADCFASLIGSCNGK